MRYSKLKKGIAAINVALRLYFVIGFAIFNVILFTAVLRNYFSVDGSAVLIFQCIVFVVFLVFPGIIELSKIRKY